MGAHTPGPWHTFGNDGIVRHMSKLPSGASDPDSPLKIGTGWKEGYYTGDNADAETLANANLIIAAPDMLSALRECANYLSDFCADGDQPGLQQAYDRARSAIARATGNAP